MRMPRASRVSIAVNSTSLNGVTYVKPLIKQRTPNELDTFKQDISIDDHFISMEAFLIRYGTDLTYGLNKQKAGDLLRRNGPNCLVSSATRPKWKVFVEIMFGGFSALLWAGAVISAIGYSVSSSTDAETNHDQLYMAVVLAAVCIITGSFAYLQESTNIEIMDSFKKMIPRKCSVIRDGEVHIIPVEELVVGDIVEVQPGECVPADIRIVECSGMKVDNSSITGESELQQRTTECTDRNPLETQNLAFFSTNVVEGTAKGVVIATGDNTFIGHIAGLTTAIEPEDLPIKKEIKWFMKLISIISIVTGIGFFFISLYIGHNVFDAFVFMIAVIIANVPEGMLVTLTACMTLTAKRMAEKNCLVKNLTAIETLGSCSVICSDKTGTLTQNRMTVSHLYYDDYIAEVLISHESLERTEAFNALCRIGILCSKAWFKNERQSVPIHMRDVVGDASESAVLKAMETFIGDVIKKRKESPKVLEVPFNSTRKYQLSVHWQKNQNYVLAMKGAPEVVLEHCSTYFSNNATLPLNVEKRKDIMKAITHLGYMGERVMGFADFDLPPETYPAGYPFSFDQLNFPVEGLRFVGLMSMIDPPRPNVLEAVAKCLTAGIRVIMVTGDHPVTAVAIARKVGIISAQSVTVYDLAVGRGVDVSKITEREKEACTAAVLTGSDLRIMRQRELDAVLTRYDEIVFARTSPQQKLKIVESFQRLGMIVAVTGDGVNDSPALKKANIGVAMGISGSDVSKNAADMIILDDNFASIVTGIEEGRLIFDNLKKSIAYVLTSNVPEILPFILHIIIMIPQQLGVLSIIMIDVGTDLWPAISLAYEKPEADIMTRKPRNADYDKLVNSRLLCLTYLQIGVIQSCAGSITYFIMMAMHGFFYDKLLGIRTDWENEYVVVEDSYGIEWTYEERKQLERKGYTAYFVAIVVTQLADNIIAKTRMLSIFQQGMTNWVLNFGMIFACFVTFCVIYIPGLNRALNMEAVEWYTALPAIPFAFLIILYDECRKALIRRDPQGWVARETYY